MSYRVRTFRVLEADTGEGGLGRAIDVFILGLIVANVVAVILETVAAVRETVGRGFQYFEWFSVVVFTIEYLLRLWSCTASPRFERPVAGRLRFALSPMALVDLAAILPTYVPMLIPVDLRVLRILRLMRLGRMLKLARYSESFSLLGGVLRAKRAELGVTGFAGGVLLLLASSLMYFVENAAQPEAFSSIPAALWWGVSTLTTVGYGDIYPVTSLGKVLGGVIGVLGVGLFALPAGILAGGFAEALQKPRAPVPTCPHCGKLID